jgi:hypothetical protein
LRLDDLTGREGGGAEAELGAGGRSVNRVAQLELMMIA